jgi:hypothetical protein
VSINSNIKPILVLGAVHSSRDRAVIDYSKVIAITSLKSNDMRPIIGSFRLYQDFLNIVGMANG